MKINNIPRELRVETNYACNCCVFHYSHFGTRGLGSKQQLCDRWSRRQLQFPLCSAECSPAILGWLLFAFEQSEKTFENQQNVYIPSSNFLHCIARGDSPEKLATKQLSTRLDSWLYNSLVHWFKMTTSSAKTTCWYFAFITIASCYEKWRQQIVLHCSAKTTYLCAVWQKLRRS